MATFAELYARHPEMAASIAALTGCSEEIASIAAGSFISFPRAPDYGLGDPPFGWYARHSDALIALRVWVKAGGLALIDTDIAKAA